MHNSAAGVGHVHEILVFPDTLQVNYNLMTVNIAMAATGLYQLYRKISYDVQGKQAIDAAPSQPTIHGTATGQ